jgi:hypothetical protein
MQRQVSLIPLSQFHFSPQFSRLHHVCCSNSRSKVASNDSDAQQQAFRDAVEQETALSGIAEAFEELSMFLKVNGSDRCDLGLKPLCEACALVSVLFGCLGIAFKFAELEYVSKVNHQSFSSSHY